MIGTLSLVVTHMDQKDARVHNRSSPEAKIALFRSLFRGREDVYARRFESRKTGCNEALDYWYGSSDLLSGLPTPACTISVQGNAEQFLQQFYAFSAHLINCL